MPYTCPINGKGATLKLNTLTKNNKDPSDTALEHSSAMEGSSLKVHPESQQSQHQQHSQDSKSNNRSFFIFNDEDEAPILANKQDQNIHQQVQIPSILLQQDETQNQSLPPTPPRPSSSQSSPSPLRSATASPKKSTVIRSNSRKKPLNAGGISKLSLNHNEILKFPKESTHAYSYAHLSPNSLAVRLSILKRSLEILVDRPDLYGAQNNKNESQNSSGPGSTSPLHLDIERFISQVHDESDDEFHLQPNASSAALAALFTPASGTASPTTTSSKDPRSNALHNNSNTHLGIKALINLLQEDKSLNSSPSSPSSSPSSSKRELAMNLHDLSLSNVTDESSTTQLQSPTSTRFSRIPMERSSSESQLKIKLLHALATPFYEPIVSTPIISLQKGASTLALSALNKSNSTVPRQHTSTPSPATAGNNRIFHSMPQKNTSPQAVFTCELNDPWNLKAANDLACLIFGVSQNSLKRLTLLDLISPDSRDFVLNRLVKNSMERNVDNIFSGQVVAIAKPGNKLTWASLWAKKKGNLIICMFDQVPCDSIDLILCLDSLKIETYKKITGHSFFNHLFLSNLDTVDQLVNHITDHTSLNFLKTTEFYNGNLPQVYPKSQSINNQRYFTMKKNGFNIPCALFSQVIDENMQKVKLKIHALPYIAGVFIISNTSKNYDVLSFNESVAKNLFGFHESQLKNQPITKIIPNFIKIMQLILNNFKSLKIAPGLVLPDHFFRQMNSVLENKGEEDFLNSTGIDGMHADGSIMKIDVQLRCSNVDTLILWITHSRTVYQHELNHEVSPSARPIMKKTRSVRSVKIIDNKEEIVEEEIEVVDERNEGEDEVGDDGEEMPSQLSILNENEIQSVSRSSSLRSSNVTSSSDLSTLSNIRQTSSNEDINPEMNENDLQNFKSLDNNIDEEHLLKLENEAIEKNKQLSKYYPKKIGLKRREKSIKEFKVLKDMGQGAYGKVILAEYGKDSNYRIVIKLIIKERILVDTWVRDRKLGTIPSEIQIMSTLNNDPHPNIMRLIDFFEDDDYYYIETPQHGFPSPGIDLFDLIELKKSMTESECKSIIKQSISAINHLHNNGIVHRDIKDENLIIDNNGVIKLIDFGSAAYVKTGPFDVFVGTLDYAAPEVLNGLPYEGKPQDVWSLGILLYTLIYKENPFYNVDEIMEGELRIPFITSEGCIQLIKKILQRDIKKRPTMQHIMKDPWLIEA